MGMWWLRQLRLRRSSLLPVGLLRRRRLLQPRPISQGICQKIRLGEKDRRTARRHALSQTLTGKIEVIPPAVFVAP